MRLKRVALGMAFALAVLSPLLAQSPAPDPQSPNSQPPASPDAAGAIGKATEMLMLAQLLEAVAEECEINLTGEETALLARAEDFYRRQARIRDADLTTAMEAAETKVEQGRKEFCSPNYEFRAKLKTVSDGVR